MSVEGTIHKEIGGFRFTEIKLCPTVIVYGEENRERAQRLLEKAEKICLVTRSLSAATKLEAKILAEKAVHA